MNTPLYITYKVINGKIIKVSDICPVPKDGEALKIITNRNLFNPKLHKFVKFVNGFAVGFSKTSVTVKKRFFFF